MRGIMANNRIKTNYPGVYYREVERVGKQGTEKMYYIVFKKDGKTIEEKAGRQYADNMTPAKASAIRSDRIEGKRDAPKDVRAKRQAEKALRLNRPTYALIWEKYKEKNEGKKKSLSRDAYTFKNHLVPFYAITPSEITNEDIEILRKNVEAKKLAPATVKQVLVLLKLLTRFAVRIGLCDASIIGRLIFDMPDVKNEVTEMMTEAQLTAYLKALDAYPDQVAAAFLRLALSTGMRKNAIMNLMWEDIDFERNFISLRGEIAKNGETHEIPMSSTTRTVLLSLKHNNTNRYVFPGKDGGPRKSFRRVAIKVRQDAGLPESFRPLHGLRHTFASLLASSGKVDMLTLQKLLTHSTQDMTQRYAHLADKAMHQAAAVVDDIFEKNNL